MRPFYVFDLDGTIALIDHRAHFVRGREKDWDAFFSACDQDQPNVPVIQALHAHVKAGHRVEIWSGRSDGVRDKTQCWLVDHGIDPALLTRMRAAGDYTKDNVLKEQWLKECGENYPTAVYDDRATVVNNTWRANGVPCFQVAPGDWDDPEHQIIQANAPPEFVLMVGPSGSGKSRYVKEHYDADCVISSDRVRERLTGSLYDQTRNDDVFAAVQKIARARLESGQSTIIDATHLRRKTRMTHAKLAPPEIQCIYVVIDRKMEDKIRDRDWRSEDLLKRHDQTFRSQLKDILSGDGLDHVMIKDKRECAKQKAT